MKCLISWGMCMCIALVTNRLSQSEQQYLRYTIAEALATRYCALGTAAIEAPTIEDLAYSEMRKILIIVKKLKIEDLFDRNVTRILGD